MVEFLVTATHDGAVEPVKEEDGRELVKGSCTSDQWEPSGPDARLRACARGRREAETVRLEWACACSGLCRS